MQTVFIHRKIVGRGKPQAPNIYLTPQQKLDQDRYYRDKRIIKELKLFKTRSGLEKFIAKDQQKDPDSYFGEPWIYTRLKAWAVYKYRKY